MADFQTVAKASEIAPGEMKLVEFEGEEVVIPTSPAASLPSATSVPMWEDLSSKAISTMTP